MSEPTIQLPDGTSHRRGVIKHCRWTIKTFVERDAYAAYDYGGSYRDPPSDTIRVHQLRVMNTVMRARSSVAAWAKFTGRPLPELRAIPYDLDLIDASETEIAAGLDALAHIMRQITEEKWLTDMAASKLLHLCGLVLWRSQTPTCATV